MSVGHEHVALLERRIATREMDAAALRKALQRIADGAGCWVAIASEALASTSAGRALLEAHARELKARDGRIDSLELRLQETEQKRLEAEARAQRAWAELDALKAAGGKR